MSLHDKGGKKVKGEVALLTVSTPVVDLLTGLWERF